MIDVLQSDLSRATAANSELAGHHNQLQKIQYVEQLRDRIIELEQVICYVTVNLSNYFFRN
jgi:hypothetical protein